MWTVMIDSENSYLKISNNNGNISTVLSTQANYNDRLDRCLEAWVDLDRFLNHGVMLPSPWLVEDRAREPVIIGPGAVAIHRDHWDSSSLMSQFQHRAVIWEAFKELPISLIE